MAPCVSAFSKLATLAARSIGTERLVDSVESWRAIEADAHTSTTIIRRVSGASRQVCHSRRLRAQPDHEPSPGNDMRQVDR
jgi:hypothetical protein